MNRDCGSPPSNADLLGAIALAELSIGRWEEALQHLTRAETLDPRAAAVARRLAYTYLRLRRLPEALAASDRAIALAPDNLTMFENKVMVYLAQGDLDRARQTVAGATGKYDPDRARVELRHLLRSLLGPASRAAGAAGPPDPERVRRHAPPGRSCGRRCSQFRGDGARARIYADSARLAFEERIRNTPDDAQSHIFRGLALAYLGRKAEAIAEGEKGVALLPIAKDGYTGPYLQHQLVRIYIVVGEPEKALDRLEPLLKVPYYLSPGWLRVDPNFDPLRNNPRFRKLVEGTA